MPKNQIVTNDYVTLSNPLVEARHSMSAINQKLFNFAITKIKTKNPTREDLEVVLSTREFKDLIGASGGSLYNYMKSRTREMIKDVIEYDNPDPEAQEQYVQLPPLDKVAYLNDGNIKISINRHLLPYIRDLVNNFTMYRLTDILEFKSQYTIRIYQLMKLHEFRNRQFKYDLEKLRWLLNIKEGEYTRYNDFKKDVLNKGVKEINKLSDYKLSFVEIKQGRKVVGIHFFYELKEGIVKESRATDQEKAEAIPAEPNTNNQGANLEIKEAPTKTKDYTEATKTSNNEKIGTPKNPKGDTIKVETKESKDTIPDTLKESLERIGVQPNQWNSLINKYGLERVQMGVEMTLIASTGGAIKNPVGWFMNSLKSDDFDFTLVEKDREQREKEEKEAKERKEKEEKERIKKEQEAREKEQKLREAQEKENRLNNYIRDNQKQYNEFIAECFETTFKAKYNYLYKIVHAKARTEKRSTTEILKEGKGTYMVLINKEFSDYLEANPPKPTTTIQEQPKPVVEIREQAVKKPQSQKRSLANNQESVEQQKPLSKAVREYKSTNQTKQVTETAQIQSQRESEKQPFDNSQEVAQIERQTPFRENVTKDLKAGVSQNLENREKTKVETQEPTSDLFSELPTQTEIPTPSKTHISTPRSNETEKVGQVPTPANQPKQIGSFLGKFKKWFDKS